MPPARMFRYNKKPPAPTYIVPLSEFHIFPKLPPEIRRMIWSTAIPGQRAIRLIPRPPSKSTNQDDAAVKQTYRLCYGSRGFTDHIPTILLHVCKESRTFALNRYKPFLGSPLSDLPIYFDFEGDTLFFNSKAEWKFMTDLNEEERMAEREEVLRIAAEMETMMEDLRDTDSVEQVSSSDMGSSELFTDGSSDGGSEDDNEGTDVAGSDGDRDSVSDRVDHSIAHDREEVDNSDSGADLNSLFGDENSANDDDFAPEGNLDSLSDGDTSSEEADEIFPTSKIHLRGGAGSPFGDGESEHAMNVDEAEVSVAWDLLPIRTLAALGMTRDTLLGLVEPSARMAQLDDQQEEEEDYGSDLDSLFRDGRYANCERGIPYGRSDDGDWDNLDFLYGSFKNKAPEVKKKKWKEQLRFIGLGGGTCPNHDSLAPFTAVVKVTVERGSAFGLTSLMKDHLLQGFKKWRRVESSSQLPIVQFVNRIV